MSEPFDVNAWPRPKYEDSLEAQIDAALARHRGEVKKIEVRFLPTAVFITLGCGHRLERTLAFITTELGDHVDCELCHKEA